MKGKHIVAVMITRASLQQVVLQGSTLMQQRGSSPEHPEDASATLVISAFMVGQRWPLTTIRMQRLICQVVVTALCFGALILSTTRRHCVACRAAARR